MSKIHPTAIVHNSAQIDSDVSVGAYSFIGPKVKIGKGSVVEHHATVDGLTELGQDNHVFPYAFIGAKTHDLKFKGGIPGLKIGDKNVFREYVSIHTATCDGDKTIVGDSNYFLAFSHLGHDSVVGNNVIVSASVVIGGHVHLGEFANIGGNSAIHQFCKIGAHSMIGGKTLITKDIPPFMLAIGVPAEIRSVNLVGMTRRGFSEEERNFAKKALKYIYYSKFNRTDALLELEKKYYSRSKIVKEIVDFCKNSKRGVI